MPIQCTCLQCGAAFLAQPAKVRDARAKFCSVSCKRAGVAGPPIAVNAEDNTATVPLLALDGSVRAYALVDAADAEWAGQWVWRQNADGYAVRSIGSSRLGTLRTLYLHRELLKLVSGDNLEGDHRNRNKLDSRRSNLRVLPAPGRPNAQNQPPRRGASSAYRGVAWYNQTQKWVASIKANGKRHHLGYFATETEAAEAARAARLRLMPYAVD